MDFRNKMCALLVVLAAGLTHAAVVEAGALSSLDCATNLMWNADDIGPNVDTGGVDAYGQDQTLGGFLCKSMWIDGEDQQLIVNTSDYRVKLAYKSNAAGSGLVAMLPGITTDFDAYGTVCDRLLSRYSLRACVVLGAPLNGGSDYAKYDYSDWVDYPNWACPGCIAEFEDSGFANAQSAHLQQLKALPELLTSLGGSASETLILAGWSAGGLAALTMDSYAASRGEDLRSTYGISRVAVIAPIPPEQITWSRESEDEIWSTLLTETVDAIENVSPYGWYLELDDSPDATCTTGGTDGDSIPNWYEVWWADSEAPDPQDTIYGPLPPSSKLLPLCATANNFESAEYAFEAFGVTLIFPGITFNPLGTRPSANASSLSPSQGYKTAWLTFTNDPYIGETDTIATCKYLTGTDCSDANASVRMFRSDNSHASFTVEQTNSAESAQGVAGIYGTFDWLLAKPKISTKNVYVEEGKQARVVISLAEAPVQPMKISYQTKNGTAKTNTVVSSSDYYASSGQVTIGVGKTSAEIYISTTTSGGTEGNETFSVTMTDVNDPSNAATSTVTIVEGTFKTVSVLDAAVLEGEYALVYLQLACPSASCASTNGDVTVSYRTGNVTATALDDYATKSGTVTFSASKGETRKSVSIPTYLNGDTDGDETFGVVISAVTAGIAAVGDGTGEVLIVQNPDDEPVEEPVEEPLPECQHLECP